MSENLGYLSGRKGLNNSLFEKLVAAGKNSGTPNEGELAKLAQEFLMGTANLAGTVSFYDFLKKENAGKKAYVCNGSACRLAGSQQHVHSVLNEHFGKEQVGEMCCLGRCYENSAFRIGENNYSGQDIDKLFPTFDQEGVNHNYRVASNLSSPILTAPFPGIEQFYKPFLDFLGSKKSDLLQEIITSGIRGRGGAGFPIGLKLRALRQEEESTKFIVCNADEGDPGAFSDRYLLEQRPHSVLLGMMIAGYTSGAEHGVVYIRTEYPESVAAIYGALDALDKHGLIGENIKGSGFNFYFKVIEGAGSYICGEETALLSSIEGQRPEVRVRPPYPTQSGLFNMPTAVNNVETLAFLPYILSNGGEMVRRLGTDRSSGSKLVCLDGHFNNPGLYEIEMGTPLQEVVEKWGSGFRIPVKALHVGGPLGGIVPVSRIPDLNLDFESFNQEGFLLGHASILAIPEDYPMIRYIEHLFEFTADESCGKCYPCSIGSVRGKELLETAIRGENRINARLFEDLLETLEIGSLCGLGGGLPLGIRNALQYFREELSEYFETSTYEKQS